MRNDLINIKPGSKIPKTSPLLNVRGVYLTISLYCIKKTLGPFLSLFWTYDTMQVAFSTAQFQVVH